MAAKGERVPNCIDSHERAVELGRMGGSANKNNIALKWFNRQYCSCDCTYYYRCPAISTSYDLDPALYQWDKKARRWMELPENQRRDLSKKDRKYHPCFLKTQKREYQNDFMNIFSQGEEGIISVIMEMYYRYISRTRAEEKFISLKDLKESIETSLAVKKSLYGDKQKVELSGNLPIKIIIERPESEPQEQNAIRITDGSKRDTLETDNTTI